MKKIIVYLASKLAASMLVILCILTISFFLVRAIPGDPFATDKAAIPEVKEILKQRYGQDKPLRIQYANFIKHAVTFDFGPSYRYRHFEVTEILLKGLPVSAFLGSLSLTIAIFAGVTIGALAAVKQKSLLDHLSMAIVVIGVCIPNFFLAPLLTILTALILNFLPAAGWGSFEGLVLPSLVLSLPYIAYISRLTRSCMIEELSKDYVRTARSKGVCEREVVFSHALRNSIIPVLTFLGPATAGILTGSFVVETIFHIPGMGKYFVSSFVHSDYGLAIGSIFLYSLLLVLFNLLVDISYFFVDPRIRRG